MIITASVGTGTHGYHPARLCHLVVDLAQCGRHFIAQGARNNHDIRLARTWSEYHAETVEVVTRRTRLHHFHCTACETKSHRPHGPGTSPVDNRIQARGDKTFFHRTVSAHDLNPTPGHPWSTRK